MKFEVAGWLAFSLVFVLYFPFSLSSGRLLLLLLFGGNADKLNDQTKGMFLASQKGKKKRKNLGTMIAFWRNFYTITILAISNTNAWDIACASNWKFDLPVQFS